MVFDQGDSNSSDEKWLNHSLFLMWSQHNFIWIDVGCERRDKQKMNGDSDLSNCKDGIPSSELGRL